MRILFSLPSSVCADRVALVGEFNGWDAIATPMVRNRLNATWEVAMDLRAGRCYRFRYLLDGNEWLNDWHSDDHLENPNRCYDSVVDLGASGELERSQPLLLAPTLSPAGAFEPKTAGFAS